MSILKNLYYNSEVIDDNLDENSEISLCQNRLKIKEREITDNKKLESIEEDNSSMNKDVQAKNFSSKHRWFRRDTNHENKENISFDQPEQDSNENKISQKLSLMARYDPKSKDYFYLISKMIRWLTF